MKENTKSGNVKWKTLKEICKISTGKLNANAKVENGEYPFFTCQKMPNKIDRYSFDTEAVLMAGNGNVGNVHYYFGKFDAYQRTYVIESSEVNVKFLYYYLKTFFKGYIENYKKEGIISYITLPVLEKFLVPLPPLKKQAEIAETLDKFTELTEELTEELTAREAQYNYYRDMLLSEEYINKKRSQFIKIKEVCIKQKGINMTAKEMKQLNKKNAPVKIFGGGNTSVTVDKKDINVDIIIKPSIIVKSRGNIDFEFYDKPFTHKNELWSYSSKNNNILNIKYLYYYLKNEIEYFKNKAIHGRMPQISNGITDNYSFYLPPIETQDKIVEILDNFEALVNDIRQGLPKEIELRQKQYEYYREKLLTF